MRVSMVENGVVSCCCRRVQSTNDVIHKIEKTLYNTHTTTQKTPENCHARGQSAQDVKLKNLIVSWCWRDWKYTEQYPHHNTKKHLKMTTHKMSCLRIFLFFNSSLSRRDPAVRVSADIVNEVVKESATQIIQSIVDEMVRDHMTVIKTGDWLEDFILEAIGPMLPRVVGPSFLFSMN